MTSAILRDLELRDLIEQIERAYNVADIDLHIAAAVCEAPEQALPALDRVLDALAAAEGYLRELRAARHAKQVREAVP